jgi:hypothetical protein
MTLWPMAIQFASRSFRSWDLILYSYQAERSAENMHDCLSRQWLASCATHCAVLMYLRIGV